MTTNPLIINTRLEIPYEEISWRFSGSGGPGGQHANTANTRVEAIFSIRDSPSLDEAQRAMLEHRFGPTLRIVVSKERSQLRNREIASDLLATRLRDALIIKKPRRATRPTLGSVQRRLEEKKSIGRKKQDRSRNDDE
ncbi:MAG TPA: alternative ribosome rescue aminoacyl-tRNA hydrolase ArfB [Acidimicrobiales bacterium]|nr:alternative ribosome rescue aminoacyl-tRNA hydrolase ArfB [Acidimicrobiales bacterium]